MDPELLSLREAARRKGVPEEELRRRILSGDLVALAVSDDRQYLVRPKDVGLAAPEPRKQKRRCWVLRALALGFLLSLLVAGCGVSMTYLCENCGATRRTIELVRGLPVAWKTHEGDVTALVSRTYPGACRHGWKVLWGGGRCQLGEACDRAVAIAAVDDLGLLDQAAKVDPRGAADLARWVLRGGVTTEEIARWGKDLPRFETADSFRKWFLAQLARGTHR